MSLSEKIAALAKDFPESHTPSVTDLRSTVGALMFYLEHGEQMVDAVSGDYQKVSNVLSGLPPEGEPDANAQQEQDAQSRIAELEKELAEAKSHQVFE